jgi:hypothetical protein
MNTVPLSQESSIEQRLDTLEQQVAKILQSGPPTKDWKGTLGMWKDDEISREIDRLGQEWRAGASEVAEG